jgi:undecaprenyl-diphosphatase
VAVAAAAAVPFGWLARLVETGSAQAFDNRARVAVHSLASPALTGAMWGITQLGSALFLILATASIVWRLAVSGRHRAAWLFAAVVAGGELLDQVLKLLFHRPRPQAFFGLPEPASYSFPSGHSGTSCCFFAMAAMLVAARARSVPAKIAVWAGAALAVCLVGLSRVYLGVHYPTDVLGGYLAGIAWLASVHAFGPARST